ncbi:MAG: YdcF family protein [Actinobacteria bacterium]|nr:YdcF family protein [Actinomycetota bacterium]
MLGALSLVVLSVAAVVGVTAVAVWREAHVDDASRVERTDIILVLGAAEYDGTPSPVFQARLDHARLLYRQGRADFVMVLGGGRPGDVTTEGEAGRRYLEYRILGN